MATWMKDRAVLLIPPKTGYALSITKDTIAKMIKGKDVEGSIYP